MGAEGLDIVEDMLTLRTPPVVDSDCKVPVILLFRQ
jgi:hypothetical protein